MDFVEDDDGLFINLEVDLMDEGAEKKYYVVLRGIDDEMRGWLWWVWECGLIL
jgi:hypothetical protein